MAEIASFGVNVDQNTKLAQNAQDTADNAADGITKLNDPNLMSVIEKQYNISQFAGLTSQYNVLVQNAKDEGINTTAVTTAYTNLNAFMATLLADATKASDVNRDTYKSLTDAYNSALSTVQAELSNSFNTDIDKMQSSVSVASQAASSATIVASQATTTGDNANQVASRAIVAANDAKSAGDNANSVANNATSVANSARSVADNTYAYANSEISIQSTATAKAQSTADNAFSQATTAIDTGKVTSQAVTDLKDGSKLTIADLENGLATKVANSEYASYKAETAKLIGSKVATKDFSTYKTQTANLIAKKVANSDFSAYQATTAKAIESKVKSKDFNTYKTQTNSAISSKVSSTDFKNLTISNRNLALGTATPFKVAGNNTVDQGQVGYGFSKTIQKGTVVTASFDVSSTTGVGSFIAQFYAPDSGASWQYLATDNLAEGTKHVSKTFTVDANQLHVFFRLDNATGDVAFSNFIISESSKEVSWTPAPEDQATQSEFTQLKDNIDLRVTKKGLVDEINVQAGKTLISSSGQLILSGNSVVLDSVDPVVMKSANIGNMAVGTAQIANAAITDAQVGNVSANKLTAGTIDFNTITGKNINASNITTGTLNTARLNVGKLSALSADLGDVTAGTLKGVDIVANTFSTPNGSFTTDANGAITANNMTINGGTLASPTINTSTINGSTINGTTINTPTLNLGTNGILTTSFNLNQATSLYAPKKGTGTLRIGTGVINTRSDNMSRYSNTKGYWYGFDDNGSMVKNGTNHTGDDYAPGYEKHDIMKSNGNVLNRSYLDAMALAMNEGGTQTFNTMLTAIGLETGNALLHQDLATEGTFEARLGTGNKYGFKIDRQVISPMIRANHYTYAADVFISRYGTMGLSTSTKVNKLDIADAPDMLQKGYNLLTLNPRQWFDKTSVEAYADVQAGNTDSVESVVDIKPVSGLVAEEVASAGLDDYVIKDENNKVQGLAYDRLWTLLLPVLRDMNDRLNEAQLEITKLKRGCLK